MPFFLHFSKIFFGGHKGKNLTKAVVFCARACYNGYMKVRMKLFAGALALCFAAGMISLGSLSAAAEPAEELFLPADYEQYLPLAFPTDAAMNDSYIVVADGSGLFVYDRGAKEYSRYEHSPYGNARNITKVGFTPDGRLFFSDQDAQLYQYNFENADAELQSNITCSTFVIDGDTLYTTAVANGTTTFSAYLHRGNGLSFANRRIVGDLKASTSIAPHMFVKDGVLYCAINSYVHAYTDNGAEFDHTELLLTGGQAVQDLTSVAVLGGTIYYTVNNAMLNDNDGLYTTAMDGVSRPEKLLEGDGFNALFSYGEHLYCVKGASVREIETDGLSASYTGYEIAADSDSPNRVSEAGDTVRARDLIVTADCGNERVSVYNTQSEEFSLLETGNASHVATDGEVIAAAVGTQILLYRYGEDAPYYTHNTESTVVGVAVVFGRCYYVTEHHYGVAEAGTREFTRSNSPVALTSDVYGNLYVADQQERVLRYTEETFLDSTVGDGIVVTEGWSLPNEFRSLRADFDGNIYYLSGNALYLNGELLSTIDEADNVFYGTEKPVLASVALGFEDNTLYLQYGSFIVRTQNVPFASLSSIAAGEVYGEVFSVPDGDALSLVDVKGGVTGVRVDADKLEETSAYFPYASYYRTQGGRGILLAERGKFSLVALFEDYDYTVALYLTEDCTEAPVEWTEVSPAPRFTTSDVALSYYPCLSEQLTVKRLSRADELTLIATVKAEGNFDFAYVSDGETTGYVPLAYLTETPPLSALPDEYTLGYLKASSEGVLFRAESGETLLVTERTQVKIYEGKNGLYFLRFTQDGVEYTAQVTDRMIQSGDPNALRMSLIIVLSVVAVGIVTAFILFRPRKKKE